VVSVAPLPALAGVALVGLQVVVTPLLALADVALAGLAALLGLAGLVGLGLPLLAQTLSSPTGKDPPESNAELPLLPEQVCLLQGLAHHHRRQHGASWAGLAQPADASDASLLQRVLPDMGESNPPSARQP